MGEVTVFNQQEQFQDEMFEELYDIPQPQQPGESFFDYDERVNKLALREGQGQWKTNQIYDRAHRAGVGGKTLEASLAEEPAALVAHPLRRQQFEQSHKYWAGLQTEHASGVEQAKKFAALAEHANAKEWGERLVEMDPAEWGAFQESLAGYTRLQERGKFAKVKAAVRRGTKTIGESYHAFIDEFIRQEDPEWFKSTGASRYAQAQRIIRGADPTAGPEAGILQRGVLGGIEMAPRMVAGGIATVVNPVAGVAFWTMQTAPSRTAEYIQRGMPVEQAKKAGLLSGMVEGVIEMAGRVAGPLPKGFRNAAMEVLTRYGKEVLEEPVQEATSEAIYTIASKDPDFGRSMLQVWDSFQESIIPVAVLGAGGAAVSQAGQAGAVAAGAVQARARGLVEFPERLPSVTPGLRRAGEFELPGGAAPMPIQRVMTPEGAREFAQQRPDVAALLMQKEKPTRKELTDAGIMGVSNAADRQTVSRLVGEAVEEVGRAEGIAREAEAAGVEAGPPPQVAEEARRDVEGREGEVRVRDVAEDRVEAVPGEERVAAEEGRRAEVAPPTEPTAVERPPTAVPVVRPEDFGDLGAELPRVQQGQLRQAVMLISQMAPGEMAASDRTLLEEIVEKRPKSKEAEWARRSLTPVPATPVEPGPVDVVKFNVADITIDPALQFRIGKSKRGTTGRLGPAGVWNPQLAQTIALWHNPETGKDVVVNGFHRMARAQDTGTKQVNVSFIEADSAEDAYVQGAMMNIADGNATVMETAKVFRDSGQTPEDLRARGINVAEGLAERGMALSRLDTNVWNAALTGEIPEGWGVFIGRHVADQADQRQLYQMLKARKKKGRKTPMDMVEEMAEMVQEAKGRGVEEAQVGLWEKQWTNIAPYIASVRAGVRKLFGEEKRVFAAVTRKGAAEILASGGTQVDVESAAGRKQLSAEMVEWFDIAKRTDGRVREIINAGAERNAGGAKEATVVREVAEDVAGLRGADVQRPGRVEGRRARGEAEQVALFPGEAGPPAGEPPLPISAQFAEPGAPAPLVGRKELLSAFPTAKVTARPGDARWPVWMVELPGGQVLTVEMLETIPIDWTLAEATLERKVTDDEKSQIAAAGAFILETPDGRRKSALGIMQLANNLATDETVRHEGLHFARQAGFFKGGEWDALVEKHSEAERSEARQEEDVANAREAWRGKPGLLTNLRAWLRKLLDRLGFVQIDANSVNVLMDQPGFWARKPGPSLPSSEVRTPSLQLKAFGRPELANPATNPALRKIVDEVDEARKIGGEPMVRPWTEAQVDADARLQTDYVAEKQRLITIAQRVGEFGGEGTLVAKGIVNREGMAAVQSGDLGALTEVQALIQGYRRQLTEVARELSAARDPIETPAERNTRLLTEAITQPSKKTQHKIDDAVEKGDPEAVKAAYVEAAREAQKLREKLIKKGVDLQAIQDTAADPQQAARALREVQAEKADYWDAAAEYWMNSILSFPPTQLANVIGNTGFAAWEMLGHRFTEAFVNTFTRDPSGAQWGEFKYVLGGILPGLSRGARNMIRSFMTERPETQIELNREGTTPSYRSRVAIGGLKGQIIRVPFRLLLAADEFAKGMIAEMEVGAQAYRIAKGEGLKGRDLQVRIADLCNDIQSPAWDRAMSEAVRLTFQERTGAIGKGIISARRAVKPLTFLVPFVTTPANIFKIGLKKSPLGALGIPLRVYKGIRNGTWDGMTGAVASQIIAWTVVLALLNNDEDDPWITGAESERRYATRREARRTFPPQSVKIGDRWWSYRRIEPFATMLATTVDWVEAVKSGDTERMYQTPFTSLMAQTENKTFLRGLGDFLEAIRSDQPGRAGRWASNFAVSWVPNLVRGGLRAAKETWPERGVWGKDADWRRMLVKRTAEKTELPLVEEFPGRDIWGRVAKKGPGFGAATDWLWRMMLPIDVKEADVFVGDRLIVNWNNKHPDQAKHPIPPAKTYKTKAGERKYMTEAQWDRFMELSGTIAARAVQVQFPTAPEDPTPEQVDLLTDLISDSRKKVKEALVTEWGGGKKADLDVDDVALSLQKQKLGRMLYSLSDPKATRQDRQAIAEVFRKMGLKQHKLVSILGAYVRRRGDKTEMFIQKGEREGDLTAFGKRVYRLMGRY